MSRFPESFDEALLGEAIDEVVIGEAFLVETLAEHIARHIVDRQQRAARRGADRRPLPARAHDSGHRPAAPRRWSTLIGIAAASL